MYILPVERAELAEADACIEAEHDPQEIIVKIHIFMEVIFNHFLLGSAEYADWFALIFYKNPVQVGHRGLPVVAGILYDRLKHGYNAPCCVGGHSSAVFAA